MKNTKRTMEFRRKREGKTNYPKRIKLLSSGKPRLVVRKTLKNIHVQLISYSPKGDVIIYSADSRELLKYGWNLNRGNMSAAYLTGLLLGIKAKGKVKEAILDIGLQESIGGSRLYSALKGALDSGMSINHSEEIIPDEKRISGAHISAYAAKLKKEDPEKFKRFFSSYEKSVPDLKIENVFQKAKEAIMKGAVSAPKAETKKQVKSK